MYMYIFTLNLIHTMQTYSPSCIPFPINILQELLRKIIAFNRAMPSYAFFSLHSDSLLPHLSLLFFLLLFILLFLLLISLHHPHLNPMIIPSAFEDTCQYIATCERKSRQDSLYFLLSFPLWSRIHMHVR